MSDVLQQFREAMQRRGLIPPKNLNSDGQIHRCDVDSRNGKGDGTYLLFLDGIPAGGFQNWQDGKGWENWRADIGRDATEAERKAQQERINVVRQEREKEDAKRKHEACQRANEIWNNSQPCTAHGYLSAKGALPHGTRTSQGKLIVPLRDAKDELHSLQFIDEEGGKRFLSGGRTGGCYFAIGEPKGILCIAEGFATGASIHEATGYAVAVAFNATNLKAVAEALRSKFPDSQLILCADDDHKTKGNPGLYHAKSAAEAVNGRIAIPEFGVDRADNDTDFNDLYRRPGGADAVIRCIEKATLPTLDTFAKASNGPPTDIRSPGGRFTVCQKGVFFIPPPNNGQEQSSQWICSPLNILAMTRDENNSAWGRLLEWYDADRVQHRWAMPMELLQRDGSDVRANLARLGLQITPNKDARAQLANYLQITAVHARVRCVERLGWHGSVYVTPTETIGQDKEAVVFQSDQALKPAFSTSGTVEQWRDSIAALAAGNSRLVFAISAALAAPLLELVSVDSGGFHIRGESSTGKTTTLLLAASVWGNPELYKSTWRATTNGLESIAALHNDGLLILDEINQADPGEVGVAAYMLANGEGKARAGRNGSARPSARWRLIFLSSGEESLTTISERAEKKANVGQEIRLADIAADAGAGMGIFETLHDFATPAELAVHLKECGARYHGTVGVEWLRHLVTTRAILIQNLPSMMREFTCAALPKGAQGQVERVARRFALVAVAGTLAAEYGLTGWTSDEAWNASRQCFSAWLDSFGGSENGEKRKILGHVRRFFDVHGASRFENLDGPADQRVHQRAGYYRIVKTSNNTVHYTETREYFVHPETFRKELCNGYDPKKVIGIVDEAGWLVRGGDGLATVKTTHMGRELGRCYRFNGRMLEDDE
jgi:uncharacterized protein (DUF927 family)/phage/plasmid primase-like uncharacterized protein